MNIIILLNILNIFKSNYFTKYTLSSDSIDRVRMVQENKEKK